MSDREFEIPGRYNLKDINSSIANKEAGAWEFKSSRVDASATVVTNMATFLKLPPGTLPKPLIVVEHGTPKPPGTKGPPWSGEMVVEGTPTAVDAYREE
jgi:hypothetical protein